MLRYEEREGERTVRTEPAVIICPDGTELNGLFRSPDLHLPATVIINGATGVPARWYGSFATHLVTLGFGVLCYDYRGVASSGAAAKRSTRWHHWGELDFEGAIRWVRRNRPHTAIHVVGHSFGGFLPGLAPSVQCVHRILTIGAQYAHWRDYPREARNDLLLKWHVAMPILARLFKRLPASRLGWGEDLPAGVARDWARGRARFERNLPHTAREEVRQRFASVTAEIHAIGFTDDPMASPQAIRRGLAYYSSARSRLTVIDPAAVGLPRIGHLGFFDERISRSLWPAVADWLRNGGDLELPSVQHAFPEEIQE